MLNYESIKKVLFKLDPEFAHTLSEYYLRFVNSFPFLFSNIIKKNFVLDKILEQNIFNKTFLNPVGIAAGFDKNATIFRGVALLGAGYYEVGSVTPKPQSGNIKPRLFRHIEEESIENSMGFNNDGMLKVCSRIRSNYPFALPIGINIGKNKNSKNALKDYELLINTFSEYCDYIVINVSSPNTPNLRDLQEESFIKDIFRVSKDLSSKPILLKLSPDLDKAKVLSLSSTAVSYGASGIILTNTTTDYSLLKNPKSIGGVSGKVLADKSYELLKFVAKDLFTETILISVGGISSSKEAYKRLRMGASLIQVYSSLIFKGPSFIRGINEDLINYIRNDGYNSISDIIGLDLKRFKKSLASKRDNIDIKDSYSKDELIKIKSRVSKWFKDYKNNKSPICFNILLNFLKLYNEEKSFILFNELKENSSNINNFNSHYNRLSNIDSRSIKLFYKDDDKVYLWEPLKTFILDEYNKLSEL